MPRGQATMRLALKKEGAEPDESWCIGEEKKFPDLVLEVALSSRGIDKLETYQRFRVPEVWFWRKGKLEIHSLDRSGGYERIQKSRLLPGLEVPVLEKCVAICSWQQARGTFRAVGQRLKAGYGSERAYFASPLDSNPVKRFRAESRN